MRLQLGEYLDARAPSGVAPETSSPSEMRAALPLVLVDPALEMQFNGQQAAAFDYLRQQFIDAVGGSAQNPNDLGYLARWQAALPESDQQLRLILGWQGDIQQQYQMVQDAGGPAAYFTQRFQSGQSSPPPPAQL
jgi:hypothetical protein